MIREVVLRRFKRFAAQSFLLPGHVVLAGPNNMGKTTLLQAIAAWDLAFSRWRELNDFNKHGGAYAKAPIARQAFAAVPVRAFDLLWNERAYRGTIEIEIHSDAGWRLTMEFISDSTEQIYVRPKRDTDPAAVRAAQLQTVYVPPMTGLSRDEMVYQPPAQRELLGQGKPGEIIRNLLARAHQSAVWDEFQESIRLLFGYELLPPNTEGAYIVAEYRTQPGGPRFDIASAGSGFQQVLMLLTFLYTNPASVLLLDEPDAHLHVILQDAIYGKLRSVAAERKSQLIVSTHSEVIINSVEPRELCMLLNQPQILQTTAERDRLVSSLGVLTNIDIMLALESPGVLYAEGSTDINLLREWARVLEHPLYEVLAQGLFWKPAVDDTRLGGRGCKAKDHFEALKLVKPAMRGVELVDGDARSGPQSTSFEPGKLGLLRWRRYEIESYLFHPEALARYITKTVGESVAELHIKDLQHYLADNLPPAVVREPLGDHDYLNTTKARTKLIPPLLNAAGLIDIPYTRYHEIAAEMQPTEIHPEVREKLDAIQEAFGL